MWKRVFLSLLYAVIAFFVGWGLYLLLSILVNSLFYGYREKPYQHETDFLFSKDSIHTLIPKYVYKIGNKSGIYFMSQGLNNMTIIESSNYVDIALDEIRIEGVDKIKSTESKTYSMYYHPAFPVIEQILNPPKSNSLVILIMGKYEIEKEIRTKEILYLSGSFSSISFSNTQNCSMVSFATSKHNEILIVKHHEKLYFVMQTQKDKSILNLINPVFLEDSN
jgi:hypothetical protein